MQLYEKQLQPAVERYGGHMVIEDIPRQKEIYHTILACPKSSRQVSSKYVKFRIFC